MPKLLKITPTREDALIARFAALAIGIHVLESLLPSPIPGIKPGFANIITLLVFMVYGVGAASWVSILRVVVGSLIVGTFLSPTFVLSFSGAIMSLVVLFGCARFNERVSGQLGDKPSTYQLSIFSIAILMSVAHMATQFLVVYVFFIPHNALLDILPVMMTAALIFGVINGVISHKVYSYFVRDKTSVSS